MGSYLRPDVIADYWLWSDVYIYDNLLQLLSLMDLITFFFF